MDGGRPTGRPWTTGAKARFGYVPGLHRGRYHALQRRLFGTRRFSREIEYRILRGWLAPTSRRVLDLACGSGDYAWAMAVEGRSVTGLDRIPEALQHARAATAFVDSLHLVAGDALRLPFADGVFDACLCNSSIEHFDDGMSALGEVRRVLRPGGQLVLTTDAFPERFTWLAASLPNGLAKDNMRTGGRAAAARTHHASVNHVVRYYTPQTLGDDLTQAGFEVLETRSYLSGWFPRAIFELHLVLAGLEFYNDLSKRLYPLMAPFAYLDSSRGAGYGVAAHARRPA